MKKVKRITSMILGFVLMFNLISPNLIVQAEETSDGQEQSDSVVSQYIQMKSITYTW